MLFSGVCTYIGLCKLHWIKQPFFGGVVIAANSQYLRYVGGRYDHHTSNVFTTITIQVQHRQVNKGKKSDKDYNVHRNI